MAEKGSCADGEAFFPSSVVGSWPVPTGSETITDDNCIVMEC